MAHAPLVSDSFKALLQEIARDRELAAAKANQHFKFVKQARCVFDAYPSDRESVIDGYQGEGVPECWVKR